MSKAKLMNELIRRFVTVIENKDNQELNQSFLGFLDACKIVLTEEQILKATEEATKRVKIGSVKDGS